MLQLTRSEKFTAHSNILEQMFELRSAQFSTRRGWRVSVIDGLEKDKFDELDPLYLCLIDQTNKLVASLRILRTTGPHMLSDVFSEVMGKAAIIRDPLVWESSRFCVDTQSVRKYGPEGINIITLRLLAVLFQVAKEAGIKKIISVFDLYLERILRRAGCVFERTGPVVKFDGLKTAGGVFDVNDVIIQNISRGLASQKVEGADKSIPLMFPLENITFPSATNPQIPRVLLLNNNTISNFKV
ncbi:MAG: hypothetical protein JKX94_06790 [Sneathiella sp.]|nr:hypothetical protein [Sneathiella sp.]